MFPEQRRNFSEWTFRKIANGSARAASDKEDWTAADPIRLERQGGRGWCDPSESSPADGKSVADVASPEDHALTSSGGAHRGGAVAERIIRTTARHPTSPRDRARGRRCLSPA